MFDPALIPSFFVQLSGIVPLAAATDYWLTKWLTPVWFLGIGVGVGLLAIMLFAILTRVLATVSPW